jgi:hypothetical protein
MEIMKEDRKITNSERAKAKKDRESKLKKTDVQSRVEVEIEQAINIIIEVRFFNPNPDSNP